MISAINDVLFPILLFLLIYSFLWEFINLSSEETADPTSAIKEAFSAAFDPEPRAKPLKEEIPSLEPDLPSTRLPSTIRALRDYIRERDLQQLVKERTGKTVSQCLKDELIAALAA